MKNKIAVIVATHKKYQMPSNEIYLPIHVGKEGKQYIGYIGDNTGENISIKNSSYCELTGMYWAWKNLECEYLGLVHYRRHFSLNKFPIFNIQKRRKSILNQDELFVLLNKYSVVLPKKRNYYIETLYSHYKHTHHIEQLDITREIIKERHPNYLQDFDKVVNQRSGYMFNMFIMKRELSDKYCEWLFDILFELETQIEMPELSQFQGRFYGRVSEIIFNVWLAHEIRETGISFKEIGVIHMEKINWIRKGTAFLAAKFSDKKYEGSF